MDACHLFLHKPWKYDTNVIHDGWCDTHSQYKKKVYSVDTLKKGQLLRIKQTREKIYYFYPNL